MIKWAIIAGIVVITLALLLYHVVPVVAAVRRIFRSEAARPDDLEAQGESSALE